MTIDRDIALARVRAHLARRLEVEHCESVPDDTPLYDFDPGTEYLVTYRFRGQDSIGFCPYLAVSKQTGAVRVLGTYGE